MKLRVSTLLVPLCLVLTACGGDSSTYSPTGGYYGDPVSGRAVKGVVQFADVDAYERIGDSWSLIATTSTNAEGEFTLANGLPMAPVRIVVRPNSGGTSRMICDSASGCGAAGLDEGDLNTNDTFDFGETMPLADDFLLSAILPSDRVGPVAVTPATTMAAAFVDGMPQISDRVIGIALNQVAALLGLSSDFYSTVPVDITDAGEVALASDSAIQQALLAAAMATQGGADAAAKVADYARTFFQYSGQLPMDGSQSINALESAAQQVLVELGSPATATTNLQTWYADYSGNHTDVSLSGSYDTDDYYTALLSLNPLRDYLHLAGIDQTGTFTTVQSPQVEWLFSQETLNLLTVMVQSVGVVLQTAAAASQPSALPASYDVAAPEGLTATYTKANNLLVVTGTTPANQTISVTFFITPLLQGLQAGELEYRIDNEATLSNPELSGTMQGQLAVEFFATDVDSLLDVLISGGTEVEQTAALQSFLNTLNVRVTVDGVASLGKTGSVPFYAYEGEISAFAEVDVPALQTADPFVELNITSGSLVSPEGDSIYSLLGSNALNIVIDSTSTLQANFGFEAFGMPAMEVEANGSLLGLGDLALEFALALQSSESLDLSAVLGIVEMLDFSVLQLQGAGGLEVPDDGAAWTFVLDGNRFDASTPNGGELGNGGTLALSYYLTSFNGGVIYSGDTLVGTVTYDWSKLGATIYLINGTQRSYFLGELAALAPST